MKRRRNSIAPKQDPEGTPIWISNGWMKGLSRRLHCFLVSTRYWATNHIFTVFFCSSKHLSKGVSFMSSKTGWNFLACSFSAFVLSRWYLLWISLFWGASLVCAGVIESADSTHPCNVLSRSVTWCELLLKTCTDTLDTREKPVEMMMGTLNCLGFLWT